MPPPNPIAAVVVPAPAKPNLAVFISVVSVQLVPLYNSTASVTGGVPPKAKLAGTLHTLAARFLAVFKAPPDDQEFA